MKDSFNWGIVGPGHIAHKFATDLSRTRNARVVAVASRSIERAREFGRNYGAEHFYSNYEAICSCPGLDAVYIATPHHLHCENTIMCLEAGMPVLCEKPLAINSSQTRKMIDKAREKQIFLMEAMWTRFLPSIYKTLELIEAGAIGDQVLLKASFGFHADFNPDSRLFNPVLGGGSLLDIGIYPLFLALLLFGEPTDIKALARLGKTNVDETLGMVLKHDKGRISNLYSSFNTDTETEAVIYGTKGRILLKSRWYAPTNIVLIRNGRDGEYIEIEDTSIGYYHQALEVERCVRKGWIESPLLSHTFSHMMMETMDKIREQVGLVYPDYE